jgi:hypothetical protein
MCVLILYICMYICMYYMTLIKCSKDNLCYAMFYHSLSFNDFVLINFSHSFYKRCVVSYMQNEQKSFVTIMLHIKLLESWMSYNNKHIFLLVSPCLAIYVDLGWVKLVLYNILSAGSSLLWTKWSLTLDRAGLFPERMWEFIRLLRPMLGTCTSSLLL